MSDPWDLLKLVADSTRMRIICLLRAEELSVVELQEILDMGQSRISSHLGLLRQAGLVSDRREGKKTFYALRNDIEPSIRQVIESARLAIAEDPQIKSDNANLDRILDKRRQVAEQYFNSVAGRISRDRCPGRSWEAIGHFLLQLTPSIRVADLGSGEGLISQMMARRAEQIYCVDSSPRMVEAGTELAEKNGFTNLKYTLGDIETVPLEEGCVDLALLSQSLHHAIHPEKAIAEAHRILAPGGRIVVIDLLEHTFEKARELYADRWLGFTENGLYQMLKDAGFVNVEVNRVAREPDEPHFETLLGVGVKTSGSSPEVAADGEESRTREAARKAAEAFARSP